MSQRAKWLLLAVLLSPFAAVAIFTAVYNQPPPVLPTLIPSLTPFPADTYTPSPTITITDTPPPSATPDTSRAALPELISEIEGVTRVIVADSIANNPQGSFAGIEVEVAPGYNTSDTAGLIWAKAFSHVFFAYDDPEPFEIGLVIYGDGAPTMWSYNNQTQAWTNVPVNQSAPTATIVRPTSLPRPANCDQAKEWGYTAEQAARWSHLDRDGDGVACYGD